ncbi:MAG: alanine racemase [Bacteriovoracaceae bacterium]|nr:alanine racemase [Bacteriovoracaceae bacterium]
MNERYERYVKALEEIDAPCLVLDLELLDENIRKLEKAASHKKIRLATKSIRSYPVIEYIQKQLPDAGVMCYDLNEALYLRACGQKDILMGYPTLNESALSILAQSKDVTPIVLMVDHRSHLEILNRIGTKYNYQFHICIDIDLSNSLPGLHFGVWRSSIHAEDEFRSFVDDLKNYPQVKLVGLMGYEAQVAGVTDSVAGRKPKNLIIQNLKKMAMKIVASKRRRYVEILKAEHYSLKFVNGGGTGSLKETSQEPWVDEVTIGSGFYSPGLFDHYQNFRYRPAMCFALPVTRNPAPGYYTCQSGGFIASGSIDVLKQPVPYLPEGMKLFPLEGAGEVQTPVAHPELKIGDKAFFRHAKAGEVCEHFQEILCLRKDKIEKRMATYRGEGKCFL